ncbi:MAG: FAD-dependent oxidoreductase, partial [Chloroflexota bacterium]
MAKKPLVVIVGAGFGGLFTARHLANQPVDVLLIDKNNYHTFTPLLYQVATCALDPSQIAHPVRTIFRKTTNVEYLLGEVVGIDPENQSISVQNAKEVIQKPYDYLVLAAGSVQTYFDNQKFAQHGFELRTLSDAINLRNHVLSL